MRCKLTFPVVGNLRLKAAVPIVHGGWKYEFHLDGTGFVTSMSVDVSMPDEAHWPKAVANPSPGVKAHITVETPHLPFVVRDVAALQGVLSLFGVERIDVEQHAIDWVAETDEEKRKLEPIPKPFFGGRVC